jgi:hypothetical protein
MTWHWLALRSEAPEDAFAVAELHALDGTSAGFIAAWRRESGRPPGALGVDPRAIDPEGKPAWLSLALASSVVLFDDPAVAWALRRVLAGPRVRVMTTMTRDAATIGGALTAYDVRPCLGPSQPNDPFARLFPTRVLHVGAGFVGSMSTPAGPGIQRYSGAPWPWSSF